MFEKLAENLKRLGYSVSCFKTGAEAVRHIAGGLQGCTVGFGGSKTLEQINLRPALEADNTVYWHQGVSDPQEKAEILRRAAGADIYVSSVNAIAETGEIINIDGVCNRISAVFYGHRKVYLVAGKNKVAADYDAALFRARNVASPLNAKRFGTKTPCVADGRCHDCKSPERICRGLSVLWGCPMRGDFEVVLIEEDLGF